MGARGEHDVQVGRPLFVGLLDQWHQAQHAYADVKNPFMREVAWKELVRTEDKIQEWADGKKKARH